MLGFVRTLSYYIVIIVNIFGAKFLILINFCEKRLTFCMILNIIHLQAIPIPP